MLLIKKMVRKSVYVITGFIVIILSMFSYTGLEVSAKEIITVTDGIFIYDDSELIDTHVKNRLNEKLKLLADRAQINFYVLTKNELNNKSTKEFADNIFSELHLQNNDILLVISSNQETQFVIRDNTVLDEMQCNQIIDKYADQNLNYTATTKNIVNDVLSILEKKLDISLSKELSPLIKILFMTIFVLIICNVLIVAEKFKDLNNTIILNITVKPRKVSKDINDNNSQITATEKQSVYEPLCSNKQPSFEGVNLDCPDSNKLTFEELLYFNKTK